MSCTIFSYLPYHLLIFFSWVGISLNCFFVGWISHGMLHSVKLILASSSKILKQDVEAVLISYFNLEHLKKWNIWTCVIVQLISAKRDYDFFFLLGIILHLKRKCLHAKFLSLQSFKLVVSGFECCLQDFACIKSCLCN